MKTSKPKIPVEIQDKANSIIAAFNEKNFNREDRIEYHPIYRGAFLYLYRMEGEKDGPIARLTYTGDFVKWEFAIYKYSRDCYDADEYLFPGFNKVDGTIEGAMKAGIEAYAPRWKPDDAAFLDFLKKTFGK